MSNSLFYVESLRKIEREAIAVLPPRALMQRAGFAAARTLLHTLQAQDVPSRILILAGPGNNGGDGFETALHLKLAGHAVHVVWCGKEESIESTDLQGALRAWKALGEAVYHEWPSDHEHWDIIIDALFGIGLTRSLSGLAREWVMKANAHPAYKIALDIPSGLSSDTGQILGEDGVVFQADQTITFIGDKPGLHTLEGIQAAGKVVVDSLQVDLSKSSGDGLINCVDEFNSFLPQRKINAHKGLAGTLCVIGGTTGMSGALLLAARAGLCAGAGKVYAVPSPAHSSGVLPLLYDPLYPELLFHALDSTENLFSLYPSAMSIGMGMGQHHEAKVMLQEILAYALQHKVSCPLLLDADALNLLAQHLVLAESVTAYPHCILTPHPLEAARLLQTSVQAVQQDRIQAALNIAKRYQSIVVLKGAGSILAKPDGTWMINPTGCSALSVGGAGDVLSGWIGGLLAQSMPEWEATLSGVWIHGCAAEWCVEQIGGVLGMTSSELILAARKVLNQLASK
jgi:ADP-dependent NAD(P)H-hydrate dehydratase / NAD(P)H-hydrate epimerase